MKIETPDCLKNKSLLTNDQESAMSELAEQAQELDMGYRIHEDNLVDFGKEKAIDFPEEQELFNRLSELVGEYEELSASSVIGILEFVKDSLMNDFR